MEKRDKELQMDNNYRHKLWNDSLDHVNSNLVNIHNVNFLVEYTNEYCLFQREEPSAKENPDISIPNVPPSLATFQP